MKLSENKNNKETEEIERNKRLSRKIGQINPDYVQQYNDNIFGETILSQKFYWEKKLEHDKKKFNLSVVELKTREEERLFYNEIELERVKEKRNQREREKAEEERERNRVKREKEENNMHDWEEKEENFHIEQARNRSFIRLEAGRPKPIDLLVKYIVVFKNDEKTTMKEPYYLLDELGIEDTEDLLVDIVFYLEIGENVEFWKDMKIVTEYHLDELKRDCTQRDSSNSTQTRYTFERGINASVLNSVKTLFTGKSTKELCIVESSIKSKISSDDNNMDVAYWTELLDQLKVYKAKSRLKENHDAIMNSKVEMIRELEKKKETRLINKKTEENETSDIENSEETLEMEYEGMYSPPLCCSDEETNLNKAISIKDFFHRLDIQRKQVIGKLTQKKDEIALKWYKKEVSREMEEDEEEFNLEYLLTDQMYMWANKYRPRKPRFFNRVHTGFEWTKYNRTHYDMDNLPPKVVQGYKFNIFYPDLIDKQKAPTYVVSFCKDEIEFCIIRFSAGPPYEDIAFKIVNREWEYSHKRGFRCRYERGIFQLWLQFKRDRYRR